MTEKTAEISEAQMMVDDKSVQIYYRPSFENAVYDVCSLEGRILFTGKLEMKANTVVDMSAYSEGSYNLFIIDGSQVHKRRFKLGSDFSL